MSPENPSSPQDDQQPEVFEKDFGMLLEQALLGPLNDSEEKSLNSHLKDPAKLTAYTQAFIDEALFTEFFKASDLEVLAEPEEKKSNIIAFRAAYAAAAILIISLIASLFFTTSEDSGDYTITSNSGATWSSDSDKPEAESNFLDTGVRYKLESGQLSLTSTNGASIKVTGPSDFTLLDDKIELHTDSKILIDTASAPFHTLTPTHYIQDIGTKYGVKVTGGETRVDVYEGRVLCLKRDEGSKISELVPGQAVKLTEESEKPNIFSSDETIHYEEEELPVRQGINFSFDASLYGAEGTGFLGAKWIDVVKPAGSITLPGSGVQFDWATTKMKHRHHASTTTIGNIFNTSVRSNDLPVRNRAPRTNPAVEKDGLIEVRHVKFYEKDIPAGMLLPEDGIGSTFRLSNMEEAMKRYDAVAYKIHILRSPDTVANAEYHFVPTYARVGDSTTSPIVETLAKEDRVIVDEFFNPQGVPMHLQLSFKTEFTSDDLTITTDTKFDGFDMTREQKRSKIPAKRNSISAIIIDFIR
ncbi:hypothetical protein [Persicirhabdus sediminis]|uniref:FecR family protein n=1 Tax=Persicirhabdus sediminis TaxID=454144 RepID=A0A8J7SK53_9BACT|nr:hypothetical protein [Persicirhabdus sediminis]MBK1792615.1 hypothetical protein [Persicirhabdus sediminis]